MKLSLFSLNFSNIFISFLIFSSSSLLAQENRFRWHEIIDTPYELDATLNVYKILFMMKISNRTRAIDDFRPHRFGKFYNIAIAYSDNMKISTKPSYAIIGLNEHSTPDTVYFSNIESIKLLELKKNIFTNVHTKALLEIQIFPNICAEEIFVLQPSYTELKMNYSTKIKLLVDAFDNKHGNLSLIGRKYRNSEYEIIDRVVDLPENHTITFDYDYISTRFINYMNSEKHDIAMLFKDSYFEKLDKKAIWWAIPSVCNSVHYPYRVSTSEMNCLNSKEPYERKKPWFSVVVVIVSAIIIYSLTK